MGMILIITNQELYNNGIKIAANYAGFDLAAARLFYAEHYAK